LDVIWLFLDKEKVTISIINLIHSITLEQSKINNKNFNDLGERGGSHAGHNHGPGGHDRGAAGPVDISLY